MNELLALDFFPDKATAFGVSAAVAIYMLYRQGVFNRSKPSMPINDPRVTEFIQDMDKVLEDPRPSQPRSTTKSKKFISEKCAL